MLSIENVQFSLPIIVFNTLPESFFVLASTVVLVADFPSGSTLFFRKSPVTPIVEFRRAKFLIVIFYL